MTGIHELSQCDYHKVRHLYEPLRYHMCSVAALDGLNWGRVFVDDPAQPAASFMFCSEASYLAGNPGDGRFGRDLNRALFHDHIVGNIGMLGFVLDSEAWVGSLETICRPHAFTVEARRHYVCRELTFDWRSRIPAGVEVQRMDHDLLARPGLRIPDHVHGWMQGNWGSAETFVRDGFGYVCVRGDEVVSWCLADCISHDGAEIGIHTAEAHRKQGLASVVVAAAVEHALSRGIPLVGWHCGEDNLGSIRTAEKVGFELERKYTSYYVPLG